MQVKWLFGPVGCCTIPLEQLDTLDKDDLLPNALTDDGHRFHTASVIILTEQCENLATNQTFVQLQEKKWHMWARSAYLASLFAYVLFLACLYVVGMEWVEVRRLNALPGLDQLDHTGETLLLVVTERACL